MSYSERTTTPRQASRDMARSTDDLSPLQNVTLRELVEWVGTDGISRPDRDKIMRHFPGSRGSFDNCVTALKGPRADCGNSTRANRTTGRVSRTFRHSWRADWFITA